MILYLSGHKFNYEMENVARMFTSDVTVVEKNMTKSERQGDYAQLRRVCGKKSISLLCICCWNGNETGKTASLPADTADAVCERTLAQMFYVVMGELTGFRPPWGIITGIRPAKFAGMLMDGGLSSEQTVLRLREEYYVKKEKARLCVETANCSREFAALNTSDAFSLYVSIPFCPTRCRYCSFVSRSVQRDRSLIEPYLDKLFVELADTAHIAKSLGLTLKTAYVGGGTPSVLDAGQLARLCECINTNFDMSTSLEFTVEAGRPDTINRDKMNALKAGGVTRISINPQTGNDEVLKIIGRTHTAKDVERAFDDAHAAGITNINADLIAGLTGDCLDSFKDSVKWVESLGPTGITVHALTLKRASDMTEADKPSDDAAAMVDYAFEELTANGYRPYYMYKQKGTVDSLENVGYSEKGYEGLYNIFIMDELHTILACGAGAVSKLKNQQTGLINRIFNYKYPADYINGFDKLAERKGKIAEFYDR